MIGRCLSRERGQPSTRSASRVVVGAEESRGPLRTTGPVRMRQSAGAPPPTTVHNDLKQKRIWVSLDGNFWFGGGAAFRGDCRNAAVACRAPG
jgi:hypothetical protein